MRITNGLMQRAALQGLQANLRQLDRAQRQVSGGLRIQRPSEDPIAMSGVLDASDRLRSIEQYQRNLSAASSRLNVEDGVLARLTDELGRARQLALSQIGANANTGTRGITKGEVDQILDSVVSLGNTEYEGSYIFGGVRSDVRPFPPAGPDPLNPPEGDRKVEGDVGQLFKTNHSGQEIFVDTGILSALQDLSVALGNDSPDDIAAASESLDAAFDRLQALVGELGARFNRIESARENLSALEVNLQTFRSEMQDVDLEEAVTELISRQVAYEAALASNSRILNLTLTDYLR